jgi:hypothetical protein
MLRLQELRAGVLDGGDADLYRGIRSLDPRIPMRPEVHDTYMKVAETIKRLFPRRVKEPLRHSQDAQIIAMEFCDHPDTIHEEILVVLDSLIGN